jgi:hypothetical protein
MNNHYHLVIETPDGNLSKGMRQLNGVYTQVFTVCCFLDADGLRTPVESDFGRKSGERKLIAD